MISDNVFGLDSFCSSVFLKMSHRFQQKMNGGCLSKKTTSHLLNGLKKNIELAKFGRRELTTEYLISLSLGVNQESNKINKINKISKSEFSRIISPAFINEIDESGNYVRAYMREDGDGLAIESARGMKFDQMKRCIGHCFLYIVETYPGACDRNRNLLPWTINALSRIEEDEVAYNVLNKWKRNTKRNRAPTEHDIYCAMKEIDECTQKSVDSKLQHNRELKKIYDDLTKCA